MTRDIIAQAFKDAGLAARGPELLATVRPCIQLKVSPADESQITPGTARIGGIPDLPAGAVWPVWRDGPLAFIAQLNLSELASFQAAKVLPNSGHLYFFYHAEQKTWGFDPNDRGSWHVFYAKPDAALARVKPPKDLNRDGRFRACVLEYREILTLPPIESADIEAFHLTEEQRDAYFDVYQSLSESNDASPSRVLGHPNPIQGDMQTECALVTGGLFVGDASGYKDPRRAELQAGARDWRLLLQVDSEDAAGMMWGDGGSLYYWINERDLAAQDFSRTWMILQCY